MAQLLIPIMLTCLFISLSLATISTDLCFKRHEPSEEYSLSCIGVNKRLNSNRSDYFVEPTDGCLQLETPCDVVVQAVYSKTDNTSSHPYQFQINVFWEKHIERKPGVVFLLPFLEFYLNRQLVKSFRVNLTGVEYGYGYSEPFASGYMVGGACHLNVEHEDNVSVDPCPLKSIEPNLLLTHVDDNLSRMRGTWTFQVDRSWTLDKEFIFLDVLVFAKVMEVIEDKQYKEINQIIYNSINTVFPTKFFDGMSIRNENGDEEPLNVKRHFKKKPSLPPIERLKNDTDFEEEDVDYDDDEEQEGDMTLIFIFGGVLSGSLIIIVLMIFAAKKSKEITKPEDQEGSLKGTPQENKTAFDLGAYFNLF